MSKLNELVAQLCPNYVEYKRLEEVASYMDGAAHERILGDQGEYIVTKVRFISSDGQFKKYCDVRLSPVEKGDVIMVMSDLPNGKSLAKCFLIDKDNTYTINQRVCSLTADPQKLLPRFLYYILNRNEQLLKYDNGYSQTHLKKKWILDVQIPVPPLKVQEEIVRLLDNFTELTAELTANLSAELSVRQKQYDYYLNQFYGANYEEMLLISEKNGYPVLPLADIGTLVRGKRFVKADSEGLTEGVPCIHYGELYTYYGVSAEKTRSYVSEEIAQKLRFAHKNDVIIVGAGENNIDIGVGVAWFGDDVAVHDACYTFTHQLNPKYISYYLRSTVYHNQIKKWVSEGKICAISAEGVGKAMMPVPPMEEQNRIVNILDQFYALSTDIANGLRTEIEARKKQYEYYRDKLLTFKERVD